MTRYVALLRGINVGGRKKVAMSDLRAILDGLGHRHVSTYLQSGNAAFSSDRPEHEIGREIQDQLAGVLGLEVGVLVRSLEQLTRIVAANPLPEATAEPARFHVLFLATPPGGKRMLDLERAESAPDEIRSGDGVLYVWYREGVLASKLTHPALERRLGVRVTARNWNTVTGLLARAR